MRPLEDQPDRDRPARHPRQGAPRAPGRVRHRRRAAGHPDRCWPTRAAPSAGTGTTTTSCAAHGRDYLILETAASRIWAYEAQRIPGLLQTRAYARALAETDPALDDDAARDRAAEAVMARQQAILGEQQPDIHLVIGQAALHQQVGSPEVMNDQLRRLAQVAADSGTVTVQVLPVRVRRARGRRRRGARGPPVHWHRRAGPCAPGRHRRRRVPGRPGRPRRLHGGVRPAAGVRAQPRAVRAAAARPGQTLTLRHRRCFRRQFRGGSTGPATRLPLPFATCAGPTIAAREPSPRITAYQARDELVRTSTPAASDKPVSMQPGEGADPPGCHCHHRRYL